MQKYLKITGLTSGFNTESIVPLYSVANILKDSSNLDRVFLRNFSSHANGDIITIFTDVTTAAINLEMCNFIADLIVKAQQQKYTKPYIEVAATDFPVKVTNVIYA